MHVAWLGDPASCDAGMVGGKTANLGRLATSFRVPPGFCVDASTYDELSGALAGDQRARDALRELVAGSYADLGRLVGQREPRVAVRSSAIGEDAGDASFAGQHETVLDVTGTDAIVEALLECWRSVSSDRAAAYRKERGIGAAPRVAVLVQLMVAADASAIAFSADPVSGARDVVVVNAARGLGDAIASGAVTPDSYTVRKSDLAIASRSEMNGAALADGDVAAIARLAVQLETVMGGPVDVECALRDGELHLLQCRPITTLAAQPAIAWESAGDETLTWEREDSHFDRVLGPLAIEFVRNGPDHGMRTRLAEIGFPMLVRHLVVEGRFYISSKPLVPAAELPAKLTAIVTLRRELGRTLRKRWDEELLPEILAHYGWMRGLDFATMTPAEAASAWRGIWERVNRIWHIHFIVTGSSYPVMEELAQTYERLVGRNGGEALAITQGLAPSLQALERDLHTLTESARGSSAAAEALRSGERSPAALARVDGAFAQAIESFLAAHGDIGQESLDVEAPPWRDDPARLLTVVTRRLAGSPEDPEARVARVRGRAAEVMTRARDRLAGRPQDLAVWNEVAAAAISAGPLTEEHNYWIDRISQALARRTALAAGARLLRDGALERADDVFLLYVREIAEALAAPRDLRALVARRRREVASWRRKTAPPTVGAPPTPQIVTPGVSLERVDFAYRVEQDGSDVLRGAPASAGKARGAARLITGEDDFWKMRPGDVLVCRQSTASWVPLYTMAAAVVTELGGTLCHAAVVAREFGVPAVVAVRDVLSTLTEGEPLEVDAAAGTVRRLFPVTWDDPEDAAIFWRRDDAHNTRVMKPLGIDYIRNGSSYGMRKRDEELGPPVLQRAVPINGRPYVGIKNLRPAAEMAEHQREAARKRRALARRMRRDWDDRYLPELKQTMTWMRELALDELDRDGAVAAWDELWRRHRRTWKIHMLVTAAAYAIMDELAEAHRDAGGGDPADALAITQGLASTLQRLETDLHELTEIARGTPRLADAIARGASLAEVRALDPSFAESADAFLATHGDALEAGEGFGSLDWEQDPAALVRAIAGRLRAPVERPDARLARLRERAARTVADARARLADRPEELARYDEVLAAALATGPLTEEHNYWLDRRNATNMGRAARTFGARLVRDGTLRAADDVFLLYAAEVRDALRDPKDLATLVAEREREQERWRSYEPPETIGGIDPSQVQAGAQSVAARHLLYRATQDDPRRWLRGAAASAGIARGPARLIRDLGEFAKFQRGDVLVCQSSNVSWIPLFVNASAVVTDVGGPLSHAAVVAREFGIPAVVGTAVGLATLVDGEPLEVDGGTGLVRRLSA